MTMPDAAEPGYPPSSGDRTDVQAARARVLGFRLVQNQNCSSLLPKSSTWPVRLVPARNPRAPGAPGRLGLPPAASCHCCIACNLIRVTATGQAKGCLFAEAAVDLKPPLEMGNRTALRTVLCGLVAAKPPRHRLDASPGSQPIPMSTIGG